jgi:hypothetical protein
MAGYFKIRNISKMEDFIANLHDDGDDTIDRE